MKTCLTQHFYWKLLIISLMTIPVYSNAQESYFLEHQDQPKKTSVNRNQEDGIRYQEDVDDEEEEETSDESYDNAHSYQENQPTITKQKKAKSEQKSFEDQDKNENSESVLSFNFLYYIIQKFKFSDILQ